MKSDAAQDRHRSIAQLSGGESRHPGTDQREACVRQGCGPSQQPRREQPSTHAGARAAHARLSRPEAHASFSVELRSDPAALRAQAASAARFALPQALRRPFRRVVSFHRHHPESVDCRLNGCHIAPRLPPAAPSLQRPAEFGISDDPRENNRTAYDNANEECYPQ
jgi:hypothetical protein